MGWVGWSGGGGGIGGSFKIIFNKLSLYCKLFGTTFIFLFFDHKNVDLFAVCGGGGVVKIQLFNLVVLLVGSIGASMPNFSFLEGVILTIPGGVGGRRIEE